MMLNFFATTSVKHSFSLYSSKVTSVIRQCLPPGYNTPTPFALYLKDNAKAGENGVDIVKKVAKLWKQLDSSVKEEYRKKAADIGAKRRSEFESLSEIDQFNLRDSYNRAKQQQLLRSRRKLLHDRNKQSGRPKLPPNAYALFVGEKFKEQPTLNIDERREFFGKVAVLWKSLSSEEKIKFENSAKQLKEVYLKKLEKWKKDVDQVPSEKAKELLEKLKKLRLSQQN